ncbi:MAG: MaoC/PaaZ C-terminal domain-containing protein [Desulfobacteraceae bacterium]|jgi:3-hydroxybutyryl-CoA dehydratase|nr:MaoC/PaaZ C-terminal domain-containing protein [Desulfobacteraceae bacterium]
MSIEKCLDYNDFKICFHGSFKKIVTEEDNRLFAQLSGDYNPIHFSDETARKAGFERRVSNGFVAESRIAAALVETFGNENNLVLAIKKNTNFLRPVYMGDEITARVEVVGRVPSIRLLKIKATCINQNKEQVIETKMLIRILKKGN